MPELDMEKLRQDVDQEWKELMADQEEQDEQEAPEDEDASAEGQGEDADTGIEEEDDDNNDGSESVTNEEQDLDGEESFEDEDSIDGNHIGTDDPKFQTEEQNRAFAELRRQKEAAEARLREAQANQKYVDLLQQLAQARGMTIDQLYDAVEEARIQQAAEEQKIPVDVYKRLQKTETELEAMRRQAAQAKYFSDVHVFAKENNLDDHEVQEVFNWLGENGKWDDRLSVGTIPFEEAFYLKARQEEGGLQALVERKARELRQKELAAKKKRQRSSAVPHTGGQAPAPSTNEISDEEFMAQMKKFGLDHHFG